ncbi:MAG: glycosyltransferase family 39 protein [Armatimonadota bacterium]
MSPSASGGQAVARSGVFVQIAIVGGLMALAAVLRFASIGDRSLWFDEAFSAFAANRSLGEVIAFSKWGDPHPPLYYLVLSGWIKMFGIGEAALRSVGALASILTVGGTWWLGRRLGGPLVGALGAFLTAVAPLHVVAAQEARMYPLLGLLTITSWAALLLAAEERWWAWPAYVAATVLSLYTHHFAFLTLAGQGVFVLAAAPHIRRPWVVSQLLIVIGYLPWLPLLIETVLSGRAWPHVRPPFALHTVLNLFGLLAFGGHILGFDGYFGWQAPPTPGIVEAAILVPFLALVLAGAVFLRKTPRSLWLLVGYLVVPLGIVLVFTLRHNVFYPRYFSYLVPPFAILTACGIAAVSGRAAPAFRRTVALALVLALLGFSAPALERVYASGDVWNWRTAAALVAEGAALDDLILLIPGIGSIPFSYYYRGTQRIVEMTPRELWDVTGGTARPDPAADEANKAAFRAYADRHRVIWIVFTRPFPVPAWERLKKLLTDLYEPDGLADFKGVWVLKTVRR